MNMRNYDTFGPKIKYHDCYRVFFLITICNVIGCVLDLATLTYYLTVCSFVKLIGIKQLRKRYKCNDTNYFLIIAYILWNDVINKDPNKFYKQQKIN